MAIAGNLPAEPNSFIGRDRDLAELGGILRDIRALTLCGPGGIGKTRLALRLGARLGPDYADGAWLVDLADAEDGELVVPLVAKALGVWPEADRPLADTLVDALRSRSLLLILDTCEHLVESCAAFVHRLLGSCPWLRVIATSRQPLRVRGETVWRVPPLGLPPQPDFDFGPDAGTAAGTDWPAGRDPGELPAGEAVRLFAERAAAVRPGFSLNPVNAAAVARICRMLDGVPLAIELAAARIRALSAGQIADRLADRFELLDSGDRTAPRRQQTLRSTVDWSYQLLTEAEQVLLRRLSVFAGWNLEMAERVCAGGPIAASDVLDLLTALIDKSLVIIDGELNGVVRYRLLDTIRQLATAQAGVAGELPALRTAHRDCMLALIQQISGLAFLSGDPPWAERVALYRRAVAERANIRAALAWSAERGDAEQGLRLCEGCRGVWLAYGDSAEGAGWLDRMLALDAAVPPGVRGRALAVRAELAFEQQDYRQAESRATDCVTISRAERAGNEPTGLRVLGLIALRAGRLSTALAHTEAAAIAATAAGDNWEEGLSLAARAAVLARQGKPDEARAGYLHALEVVRDNNRWAMAHSLVGLGQLARAQHDADAAVGYFSDALAIYRQIDARPEMARCLAGVGMVALTRLDLALARSSLTESMRLSLQTGQRLAIARGLEALTALAAGNGQLTVALRVAGAAQAFREVIGEPPSARTSKRFGDLLAAAQSELGPGRAAAMIREGKKLSPFAAAALVTADPPSGGGPVVDVLQVRPGEFRAAKPRKGTGRGELTSRELEIAALVAAGLSNRAIARRLYISEATAARHIANIFGKLGFGSRAQVAAWMAGRGPTPKA